MASSSKHTLDDPESVTCQRCRQPLLLDPSISNLTPSSHQLITSALPTPSAASDLPASAKLHALPPSSRPAAEIWAQEHGITPRSAIAESFILLSDSIIPAAHTHAETPRPTLAGPALAANLHEIVSSSTPISHPLCLECTTLLQQELQKELDELSRERDAYIEFQREIARNKEGGRRRSKQNELGQFDMEGTEEEWSDLSKRRKELEKEEDKLKKMLEAREKELANVQDEEKKVRAEEEQLDVEEEEFLLHHAELSTELKHLENELQSAKTRLLLSQSLLSHLESTNVYNDAFQIGHVPLDPTNTAKGGLTVGTINGLRLGGRPVVDWDEINAAWGLVALCIDRIAVKVGCVFTGFKIVPLGSFSRIEELPPSKNTYDLFASSDMTPTRILQNRRFNNALVALLDLLRQLVDYGREKDRGWGVGNIEIRKDRISGHSIRLPGLAAMQMPTLSSMSIMGLGSSSSQSSSTTADRKDADSGEEQWTRACRAVLAVLKRILVVESEADRTLVAATMPGAMPATDISS